MFSSTVCIAILAALSAISIDFRGLLADMPPPQKPCSQDGYCHISDKNQHEGNSDINHNKAKYAVPLTDNSPLVPKGTKPIILWWTEHIFPHDKSQTSHEIYCKKGGCITTIERKLKDDPSTRAMMFYGTDLRADDLPLPRVPWHEWALFHEESPKNNWMLTHEDALRMFNHTATFRRESDYPLSSQFIRDARDWTSTQAIPVSEKNRLKKEKGFAAIVYVQRDCYTPSDREAYVHELMKHIPVDSYGPCLNNKQMPEEIDGFLKLHSPAFYDFLAQYKFHIAFENAICQDYMTEKLFRPIEVGSVPIYMGSPKARDWMPNNKTGIFVNDFKSPKELAKFIKDLDANDQEYEKYLEYKQSGKITNKFLLNALETRPWRILGDWDKVNFGHRMYAGFECHVCDRIHERQEALRAHQLNPEKIPPPPLRVAKAEHLACPEPKMSIEKKKGVNKSVNYWEGVKEATAMRKMIEAGETDSKNFKPKYLKEKTDHYN
ncbi:alpha-(1,3)-fucosyltransferase 11 isoform X2 [Nematostella vectensis]|uniref:alpha-(1,3)-fucosyltransferase 11 isoform X2 n=1 Tax=Nematostella vectensis TaxID=45351 RepID=UPI001390461E|nr:alpha-(1,3)-fucosyltransferase 11 isoform X2 [Nematostella vectensis]